MCGIEARKPDESMRASLRAQIAIGVAPRDFDGGTLDACFFTLVVFAHFGFEVVTFCPTQIHAQKHLGPILRINAATTCMDTDDGVAFVVFPTQHQCELALLNLSLESG